MDEYTQIMLDECERVFPRVITDNDVRRCWSSDTMELMIEMFDGSAYRYDYLYKTLEYKETVDDFYAVPNNEQEWRNTFSRRLHRTITLKGYSQNEFSRRLHISMGSLSNYVNGLRTPSAYLLIKMADKLEVSLEYLTGFK